MNRSQEFAQLFFNHNNPEFDEAQWEDASEAEQQDALRMDAENFLEEYAEIRDLCGNPSAQDLVDAYNFLNEQEGE